MAINSLHVKQCLPGLDDNTIFWFKLAAEINANDAGSSANTYVRDVTIAGLELDGKDTSQVQNISNGIGRAVLDQICANGGVPDVAALLSNDIRGAIENGGQTIGGWGGSFYFWNTPYRTNTDGSVVTVGQAILSDPVEYEKFIATNAKALTDTGGFDLRNISTQIISDTKSTIIDSQIPTGILGEIVGRAVYGATNGDYAGNPDIVNGWTYNAGDDSSPGKWTRVLVVGGEPDAALTIVANPADAIQLDQIRAIRQSEKATAGFEDLPGALRQQPLKGEFNIDGNFGLRYASLDGTDEIKFGDSGQGDFLPITLTNGSGEKMESILYKPNGGGEDIRFDPISGREVEDIRYNITDRGYTKTLFEADGGSTIDNVDESGVVRLRRNFNSGGNLTSKVTRGPGGDITDDLERQADGSHIETEFQNGARTDQLFTDADGNLTKTIDFNSDGSQKIQEFDENGNVKLEDNLDAAGVLVSEIERDLSGAVVADTERQSDGSYIDTEFEGGVRVGQIFSDDDGDSPRPSTSTPTIRSRSTLMTRTGTSRSKRPSTPTRSTGRAWRRS